MKLEQLQQLITNFQEVEELALFSIGLKILGEKGVAYKTPKQIQASLLEHEHKGGTGFDCGWVYVTSDDVELIDDITNILNSIEGQDKYEAFDNLVPARYYPYSWSSEPTLGFQVRLNKYPMNVQSTTIKSAVAKEMLDLVAPDSDCTIHVILD